MMCEALSMQSREGGGQLCNMGQNDRSRWGMTSCVELGGSSHVITELQAGRAAYVDTLSAIVPEYLTAVQQLIPVGGLGAVCRPT